MTADTLNQQWLEAQQRLARKQSLRQQLTQQQDELVLQAGKLNLLETYLQMIQSDILKLESAGLAGLLTSLMGGREEKLRRKQTELELKKKEYDMMAQSLSSLQHQLVNMEKELSQLANAEADYQTLTEQKELTFACRDEATSRKWKELCGVMSALQENVRQIEKTLDAGERLLDGMNGVRLALQSASRNRVHRAGLVGGLYNSMMQSTANPSVANMKNSLERFQCLLAGVNTGDNSPASLCLITQNARFLEIITQLTPEWASLAGTNLGMLHEIEDEVRTALSALREKLQESHQRLQQLAEEKKLMLESA